jgi:hypothetical protein
MAGLLSGWLNKGDYKDSVMQNVCRDTHTILIGKLNKATQEGQTYIGYNMYLEVKKIRRCDLDREQF